MNFEKFFQLISYTAVFCGFLSLWVSDTFGLLVTGLFIGVMVAAWFLEGSRWQISEKVGTVLIVLALPVFFLAWKSGWVSLSGGDTAVAGILSRMILSLTAVKLLQKKSDRDWIFLYLMSFFEVLLAAGLSISALYFASFILYLLVMVCAIIAFEIRKTSRAVENKIADLEPDRRTLISDVRVSVPVRRLPSAALVLIIFIVLLAMPLFFLLPRVGGAAFGGGGLPTSGFSEGVTLGNFGTIQESDEVVMRVKFEGTSPGRGGNYFRGVALDTFDNKTWSKWRLRPPVQFQKDEDELIRLDNAVNRENLVVQTIYLEPLQAQVLFGLPRVIGVEGAFPRLYRDAYGAITFDQRFDRVSYKAISDLTVPPEARLRADLVAYSNEFQNYLSLPRNFDPRIEQLAREITAGSNQNRYDKAKAIETYFHNNFGYTLDQKSGGPEPLADFLFNVREGHCEYFATAMAVMLRTQGIATRIVNGFYGGEYNDAADITVVRQRNAHAWVEVYFPREKAWVTFDPTPPVGQGGGMAPSSGIAGAVTKYLEALETFWIQNFVAFDNQEQVSLARSLRSGFLEYQASIASFLGRTQDMTAAWLAEVRGENGLAASRAAIIRGIGYIAGAILAILLISWLVRKLVKLKVWSRLWDRVLVKRDASVIEFYERMQTVLATKGFRREPHQTPLEFAYIVGMPEAVNITERYHRVRFGEKNLSSDEAGEIESWLKELETTDEEG